MRKGSGGRTPRGEGRAHPESAGAVEKGSLLLMGRIFRAHGVRGEVKVWPETDDPGRFRELSTVFLGADPEHARPQAVESVRFQQTRRGTMVVLKLKGVETREAAEALRKTDVFARREDLPPLAEGEFFFDDLIGLAVVDEAGAALGRVRDVLEMPAHEILLVEREGGAEAMVPAVAPFLVDVDFDAGCVVIRPIEGLLD